MTVPPVPPAPAATLPPWAPLASKQIELGTAFDGTIQVWAAERNENRTEIVFGPKPDAYAPQSVTSGPRRGAADALALALALEPVAIIPSGIANIAHAATAILATDVVRPLLPREVTGALART